MPEEQKDAKLGLADPSPESAPEASQTQTPEAANASPEKPKENETTESVPFHKHPRWQEMVNEKNQLKTQLAELHSRMAGESAKKEDPTEEIIKDYVKAGMKEEAARALVAGQYKLSNKVAESKVAPLEKEVEQAKNRAMFAEFAKEHQDFESVRPLMEVQYNGLTDQAKAWVSSAPEGLQYLYDRVKTQKLDEEIKKAFDKGIQEGYKRKQEKSAIAPSTGASVGTPKGTFSDEEIANMSLKEYQKNREAILSSRGVRQ